MSMHGSLVRTIVSKSVKFNLTPLQASELFSDVLDALEWDDYGDDNTLVILDTARYMLTQKEGIYDGTTYEQIRKFIEQHG